jgi:hypothetical protein
VDITGGTNDDPSSVGKLAKASLIAKGWTVNVERSCSQPPFNCSTNVDPYCVTDFSYAWAQCGNSLTTFPLIDVSSGINFYRAWISTGITSFPLLDVSSGTNFNATWAFNYSLTSFPLLDVSSGTTFSDCWELCISLTSFPPLNFSSAINLNYAWYGCSSLSSFPASVFDNCTATSFTDAWHNCALNQQSVDNILISINTAGQSSGTLGINGGTSSPPGPTGLAAKLSLVSRGWTVTTN